VFESNPRPRLLIIRLIDNKLEAFTEIPLSDTDAKILEELGIPSKGSVVAEEHVEKETKRHAITGLEI